ncbi:MAG: sn-glycerol-3-phosphate ABC transporter ATP-binding protein UgpC [Gammaproteobacteria bacterium]|jgi:multiple sugar transport system ATP-binding protein
MAEIILEHVSKRFPDGTLAVKEADFTVRDGELFILVGPSGCGKSTLLNLIVGLEGISGGSIKLNGRKINDLDPRDRNMAMVFQSYAIYPHMTVRENLAFPLRLAKVPAEECRRRVEEAAAILELDGMLERKPRNLSGGQRQRVAMGRAIVRKPEVFLLDEPLSNLDARLRVQMRTEIARLQRRLEATMVYVTHDQTEAMTLGDRIAVMRDGSVQQIGDPRQLYAQPRNLFVAGFIGSPPMNFLPARVEGSRLRLPLLDLELPDNYLEHLSGQATRCIAGIRPEDFLPATQQQPPDAGSRGPGARVEVVEWLGSEQYAHISVLSPADGEFQTPIDSGMKASGGTGNERIIVRLEPDCRVTEGGEMQLQVDASKLHLFDSRTGERLIPE